LEELKRLVILRRGSYFFACIVVLLIIFLPGYSKLQELRDKNRDMAQRIKKLAVENALLQQELKRAQDDPLYQEKAAREKMGVVRKGEVPVKIVRAERE
jgi:cell division protein FtsB